MRQGRKTGWEAMTLRMLRCAAPIPCKVWKGSTLRDPRPSEEGTVDKLTCLLLHSDGVQYGLGLFTRG